MSLKELTLHFPEETITFAAGSFKVRGLSLTDILVLVSFHKEQIAANFEEFVSRDGAKLSIDPDKGLDFGMSILHIAPTIGAHIIAQAEVRPEGEPAAFETAVRLPADVQIEALDKILTLTFQTEGGPKKVMDTIMRAFAGTIKFTADLAT